MLSRVKTVKIKFLQKRQGEKQENEQFGAAQSVFKLTGEKHYRIILTYM